MALNLDAWDRAPRRVAVDGRRIRVGWIRHMDPHGIGVTRAFQGRVALLVVPLELCSRPEGPGLSLWSSGCTLAIKDAVREHKRPRLDRHEDHAFLTWPSQSVPAACGGGGIGPGRGPPARATAAAYDVNGGCGAQGAGLP